MKIRQRQLAEIGRLGECMMSIAEDELEKLKLQAEYARLSYEQAKKIIMLRRKKNGNPVKLIQTWEVE